MSINVTVHGNPISIKRGKLVNYDVDSEFERRRQIRLQQVRQQSKEIAADVRNRVRKEKSKQLTHVEKQGEKKLKHWQARKLHNLQKHYQQCIEEIGSAHTKAALERNVDEVLAEITSKNQNDAEKRGKIAADKQKAEDRERNLQSSKAMARKGKTRAVEDARSAMVSKLKNGKLISPKKKKKRRTISTDVTITNNLVTGSELSNSSLSDIENISYDTDIDLEHTPESLNEHEEKSSDLIAGEDTKTGKSQNKIDRLNDDILHEEDIETVHNNSLVSAEERSSECDIVANHSQPCYITSTKISDRIYQRSIKTNASDANDVPVQNIQFDEQNISSSNKEIPKTSDNLPYIPTVSLRKESVIYDKKDEQDHKVKCYDHFRHFNIESNIPPVIHKISKESLRVHLPSEEQESDLFYKTMEKSDKKAQDRGIKATEKARIQKSYKKLIDELPVLQKQERLASMRTHNPTHHMSNERLQEQERERQNRIENMFEEYYHKSKTLAIPTITIKPVQKSPPAEAKMPFKILDITESPPQLNLAEWDTEDKTTSDVSVIHQPSAADSNDVEYKQKSLANLLHRVNKQRELLYKEVSTLPTSSNLQKILEDKELLKIVRPCSPREFEKSKENIKVLISTATSPLLMNSVGEEAEKEKICECDKKEIKTIFTSNITKLKTTKKQKILIRNEETQTSPQGSDISPQRQNSCDKIHAAKVKNVEATQPKHDGDTKENLCEIIIKMNEESNVKICASTLTKDIKETSKKTKVYQADRKKENIVILKTKSAEKKPQTQKSPIMYEVSTSTTYLSPPEVQPVIPLRSDLTEKKANEEKSTYKDVLLPKPQQSNISKINESSSFETENSPHYVSLASEGSNKKEINPRLVKYIKKLLSMSRQSIDELTVSTISDVSTPGSSILDTSTNNSLVQLQNVMSRFNLNFCDVQKYIMSSETENSLHEFTEQPECRCPASSKETSVDTNKAVGTDSTEQLLDQSKINLTKLCDKKYENVLAKYSELTQTCYNRITTIDTLIDKVRKEKENFSSPPSSDINENSVSTYLNFALKSTNDHSNVDSSENKKTIDQDESTNSSSNSVDRYLLAIGEDLEKSLPKRSSQIRENCDKENTDKEPNDDVKNNNKHYENSYVPVLLGIPKYNDKDQASNSEDLYSLKLRLHELLRDSKSKPPPSLLRSATRHFTNIDMTPHELSTIIEIDTVASSRNDTTLQDMIPSKDNLDDFPVNEKQSLPPDCKGLHVTLLPVQEKDEEISKSTSTNKNVTSQRDETETNNKKLKNVQKGILKKTVEALNLTEDARSNKSDISDVQLISSDQSTSSSEDIARILQNLGLNWAVPTLRKTQEALALSSTSSSENSIKKYVSFKDSSSSVGSELISKDILGKEFLKKLCDSNLISENSSDISVRIQESQTPEIENQSKDRSQQRTSTPLLISSTSSSADKKKDNLFTCESDLSSIQINNEMYLSLPQATLDTNISLNKSK